MKKWFLFPIVFFAAVILNAQSAGGEPRSPAAGSTLYVAVKTVDVKSSPGFFAGAAGTLNHGDAVTVIQPNGKWINIRGVSGLEGFAPADAFSVRRILSTGGSVSASEFAMAGKGFSDNLERLVRSSSGVDYSGVDAMEKRSVSPAELRAFLREGRLAFGE